MTVLHSVPVNHLAPSTAQAPAQPPRGQIVGLDLIRFLAAVLVVVYHLGFSIRRENGWPAAGDMLAHLGPLLRYGWVGVPVFFVLSGFVITYSAQKAGASDFLRGRLLRLYPAVWVCATLTLIGMLLSFPFYAYYVRLWMSSMLLLPTAKLIDTSYWTLGIEMAFYALIYGLLVLRRFSWLSGLCVILTVISSLALTILYLQNNETPGHAVSAVAHFVGGRFGQLLLLQHGVFFAAGATLWLCLFRGVTSGRVILLLLSVPGGLLSIHHQWHDIMNDVGVYFSLYPAFVIWLVMSGAMIVAVQKNERFSAWLGPRGVAISRTLGLVTYPLYLLNQRLGGILLARLHGRISDLAAFLMTSVAALLLAYLVVRYAEPPVRKAFRRILHGPPKIQMAPAASLP